MDARIRVPGKAHALTLRTPTLRSEFGAYVEGNCLVVTKGSTWKYDVRCIDDLAAMLRTRGDWVFLGPVGEEAIPDPHTVEEWARASDNPVSGFYGVTNGRKGRFASFVPPVLEWLKMAEVEHNGKNNRMRAK